MKWHSHSLRVTPGLILIITVSIAVGLLAYQMVFNVFQATIVGLFLPLLIVVFKLLMVRQRVRRALIRVGETATLDSQRDDCIKELFRLPDKHAIVASVSKDKQGVYVSVKPIYRMIDWSRIRRMEFWFSGPNQYVQLSGDIGDGYESIILPWWPELDGDLPDQIGVEHL